VVAKQQQILKGQTPNNIVVGQQQVFEQHYSTMGIQNGILPDAP
jgi:hypothetical protein|tara:strand:- start:209 stop:340 length:132 start_codon:yes stop_codon:yes gene_type:complete